jgi:mannose-6-phosphate isomerase-like protein (cupin superfamily)
MPIEVLDLVALAQGVPVDTDRPITADPMGDVLIIRLSPQSEFPGHDFPGRDYPDEVHGHATETITALAGQFAIIAGGKSYAVRQGQCCRIPPGLHHRWATQSDAVVLVHFGAPIPV